jgi:hypothetical protein
MPIGSKKFAEFFRIKAIVDDVSTGRRPSACYALLRRPMSERSYIGCRVKIILLNDCSSAMICLNVMTYPLLTCSSNS